MSSIFEKYMKLMGYNICSAERELGRILSLSKRAFRKYNEQKRWEIAKFHYDNNPFYHKKVGKCFPRHWEDLPVMTKRDFQKDLKLMMASGYCRKNTYISNTSGSSGHPFFFAKNKEAHAMDWAVIKNRYEMLGLSLNCKQARFFGITLEKISYLKEKIKDLIMNRVRFPVFDLSDETLASFVNVFRKKHFDYIYGYTNSIVLFARFLIRNNLVLKDICATLRYCITTSEVLTQEDRIILKEAFGVNIINEYGASETGLIAFESPTPTGRGYPVRRNLH